MKATSRDLIGRRIVKCEMRRFSDGQGGWANDPVLVLDNGRRVFFLPQETNLGQYGVYIGISEKENTTQHAKRRRATKNI